MQEDIGVVEPGHGVIGRGPSLLMQSQGLLHQRKPGSWRIKRPVKRSAVADDRGRGGVGVVGETAVGLLGDHPHQRPRQGRAVEGHLLQAPPIDRPAVPQGQPTGRD